MPYGMPKNMGGDTKEADKWMEKCVSAVETQKDKKGKTYGKQKAVAICKANYMKKHSTSGLDLEFSLAEMDMMDEEMDKMDMEEEKFMNECCRKMMKEGKDKQTALLMCEDIYNKSNKDNSVAEYIVLQLTNKRR